ncbi:FadR/GntR family transcriptional regulator [Roseibium sp. H3510]|uniref:FadR/GntR family transcriptional regulator n=1 Tax=Roseibium algae TaxID=3123038 RepID=A0ABU8TNY2_9HYPH
MANLPRSSSKRSLVDKVCETLRQQIKDGQYSTGDRLPSEAGLTAEFSVSRTVVREAIATLRADGLVEPKQGAGVFVLQPSESGSLPFRKIDPERVSSMIDFLELRTAVETEAAGLAAQRRSPSQEEAIIQAHRKILKLASQGLFTADADFELHLAIAEATNNPRFGDFLQLTGPDVIPRRGLTPTTANPDMQAYLEILNHEHELIVTAIINGDETSAREAMRSHLKGSQSRYRKLLRQSESQ